nr:hypothetical protein CFP56_38846 [Quercus suber]
MNNQGARRIIPDEMLTKQALHHAPLGEGIGSHRLSDPIVCLWWPRKPVTSAFCSSLSARSCHHFVQFILCPRDTCTRPGSAARPLGRISSSSFEAAPCSILRQSRLFEAGAGVVAVDKMRSDSLIPLCRAGSRRRHVFLRSQTWHNPTPTWPVFRMAAHTRCRIGRQDWRSEDPQCDPVCRRLVPTVILGLLPWQLSQLPHKGRGVHDKLWGVYDALSLRVDDGQRPVDSAAQATSPHYYLADDRVSSKSHQEPGDPRPT